MRLSKKSADILVVGLLFVLLTVAFLARSPYAVGVPLRDSGIFLSIGSDVLRGKVLYQQTWDNKQPLLYGINAVGLWLGGGSVWGVWGLELGFLLFVFYATFRQIRPALTPLATFVVIAIAFLGIFPFMGGNYSEEYSLVIQAGILSVLLGGYLPDRTRFSRGLASGMIGLLVGLVFCIKQTYLDIPVTVLVFIVFLAWVEKDRRIFGNLLLVGVGFLLVNLPVFIYFQLKGALHDYLVDAFLFNLYYSQLSGAERIASLVEKIKFIAAHPFFFLVASVWLGALGIWLVKTRQVAVRILGQPLIRRLALIVALAAFALFFAAQLRGGDPQIGYLQKSVLVVGVLGAVLSASLYLWTRLSTPPAPLSLEMLRAKCAPSDWRHPGAATLLFLGLIDFPVVMLSISLSGKLWTHYYLTLFPACILVLAGSLAYLYQYAEIRTKPLMLNSLLVAALLTGSIPPLAQVVSALGAPSGADARSTTAAYLKTVTSPDDTILVWGWESVIYFLADRDAPTRFALPFAFYLDTPYLDDFADTLLQEVKAHPPAYIADLNDPSMPLIGGRPPETCVSGNQIGTQKMVDFLAYVCANYEPDRDFEEINIYKLRIGN